MKSIKLTSIALLILLVGAIGWVAVNKLHSEPVSVKSTAIPVTLTAVEQSENGVPVLTNGRLESQNEMMLSFKIGGIISAINVRPGQSVKAGQVLASLDPVEINAQVQLAEMNYRNVQKDYDRVRSLFNDKVATLEQLQDAETGLQAAKTQLDIAAFNQQYSVIRAPSNGRIYQVYPEASELIESGTPVIRFGTTTGNWLVSTFVSDKEVVRIQTGDSALIRFSALPLSFKARVVDIAYGADPLTGTFEVNLVVLNTHPQLRSGFMGDVSIYPGANGKTSWVPMASLVDSDRQSAYVFVPVNAETSVEKRKVTLGHFSDNKVQVLDGLDGVTAIVKTGSAFLRNGSLIEVVNQSPIFSGR